MCEGSGQEEEDWFEPIRVQERAVDVDVWRTWTAAARAAATQGRVWGLRTFVAVALSAGVALIFAPSVAMTWAALFYVALVGGAAWSTATSLARRRHFAIRAQEMRVELVRGGLLTEATDDELFNFAMRDGAQFEHDSTAVRLEEREEGLVFVASVYALEHSPDWNAGSAGGP